MTLIDFKGYTLNVSKGKESVSNTLPLNSASKIALFSEICKIYAPKMPYF